jgi:hypothetical protein
MGFENIIALQFFRTIFKDGLKFIPGLFDGRFEPLDLILKLIIRDGILFDDIDTCFVNQVSLADTDTGRGIDSF